MTVTIALVDDHHVVRQGLRALLAAEHDFNIVGEAGDGLAAVQLVQKLRPDVLVMDLMMPGLSGLEVTRQVNQFTRVIILSMHANEAYVLEALRNGAYGYVLKDSTADDLVAAVRMVMEGRRYLSAPLSDRVIESYVKRSKSTPLDPYDTLTTREREVFQLVAQGLSNNEISERLSLSPRTVEIHRSNAMRKLNLHNQTELIRYAIKKGVLSLEE
jgi:DNA-binding NarL/FixJ family response regulator